MKKLLLASLIVFSIAQISSAENISKNLLSLTKAQFKESYFQKFNRFPDSQISYCGDLMCLNRDAELFLDQMITTLEKIEIKEDTPIFLTPQMIFLYGIIAGVYISK
jgi:hypothetical protein